MYMYINARPMYIKPVSASFSHSFKGNLEEQYVCFWKDQIQQQGNQGKLRTFKKFKTNLNFEEYLNEISKC